MLKSRIDEIKEFLKPDEAALITSDVNRLYFTGFRSSAGAILITKKRAVLLIDFRYFEKAKSTINHTEVVLLTKFYSQINEILKEDKHPKHYICLGVIPRMLRAYCHIFDT